MSTKEINLKYENSIKNFVNEQKLKGNLYFRFSFKFNCIENETKHLRIEVLFDPITAYNENFLMVFSDDKDSEPVIKSYRFFDKYINFYREPKQEPTKTQKAIIWCLKNDAQGEGNKMDDFWDQFVDKMKSAKINTDYDGNVSKLYPKMVKNKRWKNFGIYIKGFRRYKYFIKYKMSNKMELYLRNHLYLSFEEVSILKRNKITFFTCWDKPKENIQNLPKKMADLLIANEPIDELIKKFKAYSES